MKKQLLTLLFIATSLLACKKKPTVGEIEVRVSYLASTALGQLPDAGANVYLFKQEGKTIKYASSIRTGVLEYQGQAQPAAKLFSAQTNAEGISTIANIPFGDYLLVVSSKNRPTYSIKPITLVAEHTYFSKNFTNQSDNKPEGESW